MYISKSSQGSAEKAGGGRTSSPGKGNIPLLSMSSTPVLGPTQPPVQWVPETLSLGVKRPMREADYSPPSSANVKNT
jgi:hypothetical protein